MPHDFPSPGGTALELTYATPDRAQEFLTATLRGFYAEFEPEPAAPALGVFEAERCFGFATGGRWVTTCGAFSRTMTVPGGSVPVAAVTYVTVQPTYRRRGLLSQMMRHQLEDVAARGSEPLALLWASEASIYGRFGYGQLTTRLRATGPTLETRIRSDVDLGEGWVVEVDRDRWLPVAQELHARLLPDRPGSLARPPAWWEPPLNDHPSRREGASAHRFALHVTRSGEPDGYLAFRTRESWNDGPGPGVEVQVTMLDSLSSAGYARLWRFALDLDLVRTFRAELAVDEPLRHLVADAGVVSATVADGLCVRLVDLPRALVARVYSAPLDVVLEVRDSLLPQNDGRFRLRVEAGGDRGQVERVSGSPDLTIGVRDLASTYLGSTSADTLARAGLLVEHTPGAAVAVSAAFSWPRQPFSLDFF